MTHRREGWSESDYTKAWAEALTRCNCVVWVLVGGDVRQQTGLPDRYVAGRGLPGMWVEHKRGTNSLSKTQLARFQAMAKHDVPRVVVTWDPPERRGWVRYSLEDDVATWEQEIDSVIRDGPALRQGLIDHWETVMARRTELAPVWRLDVGHERSERYRHDATGVCVTVMLPSDASPLLHQSDRLGNLWSAVRRFLNTMARNP